MSFLRSISRAVSGVVRQAAPLAMQLAPTLMSGGIIPPIPLLSKGLNLLSPISGSLGQMSGDGSTASMPDPALMMSQRYTMSPIQTQGLTSTPQESYYFDNEELSADEDEYYDEEDEEE